MVNRHLRWLVVPLLVLPLGWLLLTGFGRDPRDIGSPLIGRPAPAWTLTMLTGGTVSSQDLAGRPSVVNFWASWCPPCIGEHPILAAAYERYGDELEIVGALYQDATADAEGFLARYGDAGYPHVVGDEGRLAIEFGVTGPPETFFVDAGGIVRAKQFGPLTNALIAEHLASILPGDGLSGAGHASLARSLAPPPPPLAGSLGGRSVDPGGAGDPAVEQRVTQMAIWRRSFEPDSWRYGEWILPRSEDDQLCGFFRPAGVLAGWDQLLGIDRSSNSSCRCPSRGMAAVSQWARCAARRSAVAPKKRSRQDRETQAHSRS